MRYSKRFLVVLGLLLFAVACTPPAENNTPVATAQTVSTQLEKAITISLAATDIEKDELTFKIATQPTQGTLSGIENRNKVVYTPNPGFTGQDSFTFTATDLGGSAKASAAAKVTINVTGPENNAPVAQDGSAEVAVGGSVKIILNASDLDADPLTYTLAEPSAGEVVKDADFDTSRSVTYTTAAAATAGSTATFDFTVDDGKGGTDTGTITVSIVGASGTVTDDTYSTIVNTLLEAGGIPASGNAAVSNPKNILANDTATAVTAVASKATDQGGTVRINADGTLRYTPAKDFVGLDTFTYSAPNGDTATVTVEVVEANPGQDGNQVVLYARQGATGGDGTSARPLGSLLSLMSASKPGDTLVLYAATYAPADVAKYAIQLKSNQKLLGQEADVSILGQVVLKADTVNKTILSKPENVSISLAEVDRSDRKNIVVSNQANNVTIAGLTINRANAAGTATADVGTGVGQSGIVTSDQMTGTLTITDVSILYPGGYGLLVQETDGCPDPNCDDDVEDPSDTPTSTARYNLIMKNVRVIEANNDALAINDPISVDMDEVSVVGVREGKSGVSIESEHVTAVKITGSSVASSGINARGFDFLSNNNFGRSTEAAKMTVDLSDNRVTFVLTEGNDLLGPGDPPVAAPDGRVDGTAAFRSRVLDDTPAVAPGSSAMELRGLSASERADSPRACDAASVCTEFIVTQTVP